MGMEHLVKCTDCGEHVWISDAVEYKDRYYCPKCAEERGAKQMSNELTRHNGMEEDPEGAFVYQDEANWIIAQQVRCIKKLERNIKELKDHKDVAHGEIAYVIGGLYSQKRLEVFNLESTVEWIGMLEKIILPEEEQSKCVNTKR